MNPTIISIFIATGLAFLGVAADACMKKAGAGATYMDAKWFVLGALIYMSTFFGWFFVMKTLKLSTVGVVYGVSSVIFLVLAGMLFFHERLNVFEWVGILMAVLSIVLLSKFA